MRFSQNLVFALVLLSLSFGGCAPKASGPIPPRLAVVVFDNQSGAAGDKWIASLISIASAYQLREAQALAASVVEDSEGWRQAGVGRVLSGNYRRQGKAIRIEALLMEAATGKVLSRFEAVGGDTELTVMTGRMVEQLLGVKAAALDGGAEGWVEFAKAVSTRNPEAIDAFVSKNPAFAPAYPLLASRWVQTGRRDQALELVKKFPAAGDSYSKAQLALAVAGDGGERLKALVELAKVRSGDPNLLAEAGSLAGTSGDWELAAAKFRELTRIEPGNGEWWNQLGYAEANLNRLPEAVAALNEFQKLAPNEPNVIDSLGEVHYMNRQFGPAAKYFDAQTQRFPAFQNGVGWRKAAFAYYFAGDPKTADLRFESWARQTLAQAPPSTQVFQRAMWLARTGRGKAGLEVLEKEIEMAAGERKWISELHLAMLEFGMDGKRPKAESLKRWNEGIKDTGARNEFSIFALLAQQSLSEEALKARISAAIPQPQLAQLRGELLAAATAISRPVTPVKPKVYPLPNVIDGPLDAMLLRSRLAVLR